MHNLYWWFIINEVALMKSHLLGQDKYPFGCTQCENSTTKGEALFALGWQLLVRRRWVWWDEHSWASCNARECTATPGACLFLRVILE